MKNSKTILLLKAIGESPVQNLNSESDFSREQYQIAYRSKIPLSYLNSLSKEIRRNIPEFAYHKARFQKRMNLIKEIAELFEKNGIEHVIFKTLKPFPEYAADIDILNLGSKQNYRKMAKTLTEDSYYLLDQGPLASTLCDIPEEPRLSGAPSFSEEKDFRGNRMGIMIDVHNQIGISNLAYIDKEKVRDKTTTRKVGKEGTNVTSFPPQIELAISMAHSVIKEREYLLSDYYTISSYLEQMDKGEIRKFIDFVSENHLMNALRAYLEITLLLHKKAFDTHFEEAERILDYLGVSSSITLGRNLKDEELDFPYRFDRKVWLESLVEKLKEENFRKSVRKQIAHSPDAIFTRKFLEKIGIFKRGS